MVKSILILAAASAALGAGAAWAGNGPRDPFTDGARKYDVYTDGARKYDVYTDGAKTAGKYDVFTDGARARAAERHGVFTEGNCRDGT